MKQIRGTGLKSMLLRGADVKSLRTLEDQIRDKFGAALRTAFATTGVEPEAKRLVVFPFREARLSFEAVGVLIRLLQSDVVINHLSQPALESPSWVRLIEETPTSGSRLVKALRKFSGEQRFVTFIENEVVHECVTSDGVYVIVRAPLEFPGTVFLEGLGTPGEQFPHELARVLELYQKVP